MGTRRHGNVARHPGHRRRGRTQSCNDLRSGEVFASCKANHIAFLNSMNKHNVIDMIKEGVMVGPANAETAEIGRKFTNRPQPY